MGLFKRVIETPLPYVVHATGVFGKLALIVHQNCFILDTVERFKFNVPHLAILALVRQYTTIMLS